ncbi:MAG: hypothetical protein F4Y63_01860 [Chloroflexi bacterium]|nr:hypothetical protein [Chloroflexota bacterium]MYF79816.1 hypothetical protein [Chloroflexota bacterium]MYK62360.1 hypothetical protein [Chloroflexota bacterium]
MASKTHLSIEGERWLINGRSTYEGRRYQGWNVEGLLMNSRMTNAVFDDENPVTRELFAYPDNGEWDADRNTDEFIAMLPVYRSHGLLAVTVNLQGGSPTGYYREPMFRENMAERGIEVDDDVVWAGLPGTDSQPWYNSAFNPDGSLKSAFQDRTERLIAACDRLGMAVILGYFYFGQDERLVDERAVCRAVDDATRWVLESGYGNVLIEINNEANIRRYEHEILQPHRVAELIERAQAIQVGGRRLLVGTSYGGGRVPDDDVAAVSDYIMVHGNGVTEPARIAGMVADTRALPSYTEKPILFTEDDHFDFDKPENNFLSALSAYASWGYFDPGDAAGGKSEFGDYRDGYQNVPVNWGINTPRKQGFFDLLSEITGEAP